MLCARVVVRKPRRVARSGKRIVDDRRDEERGGEEFDVALGIIMVGSS